MPRLGFSPTVAAAAVATASCLAASGSAPAAEPPSLCLGLFGGKNILELGVSKNRIASTDYGPLAGRTFGPRGGRVSCFGVKPLPVSGSYVTREDGSVVVILDQIILVHDREDTPCGRTVYTLLLRLPGLGGTLCSSEPFSDVTDCLPIKRVPCPSGP